ncbi:hypothetical protein HB81_000805 [Salmonella enterica subsp. enterica]|nr:hypothetical protein [Salmonella enterica subsp. enterica]
MNNFQAIAGRQSAPETDLPIRHSCTSSLSPIICASLPSPVYGRTAPDIIGYTNLCQL